MAEPTFGQAQFRWDGNVIEARMSRIIDDSLDRVWAALTDCEELVKWLAPGEIEPVIVPCHTSLSVFRSTTVIVRRDS